MRKIKKYPNRRLYDTETSSYIKLTDIRDLLTDDYDICISDISDGKDITRSVLLNLLAEDVGASIFTEKTIITALKLNNPALAELLARYLEKIVEVFIAEKDFFEQKLTALDDENPFEIIEKLAAKQKEEIIKMQNKKLKK
ncbi:MAG: hypothetical protein IJ566_03770 [Cardiobacteriaceae bacterium]|nr:hypothetical protein [Cardiobacteriaceae bacterium]